MMNWRKSMDRTYELLLVIGLMTIVLGFINLKDYSPMQIIVSGIIITFIGTWGILKRMKEGGKKK